MRGGGDIDDACEAIALGRRTCSAGWTRCCSCQRLERSRLPRYRLRTYLSQRRPMSFIPDNTTLIQFAIATVILAITPGPDMTLFVVAHAQPGPCHRLCLDGRRAVRHADPYDAGGGRRLGADRRLADGVFWAEDLWRRLSCLPGLAGDHQGIGVFAGEEEPGRRSRCSAAGRRGSASICSTRRSSCSS